MTSSSSLLSVELRTCTAVSHSSLWPAQGCKSPAVSRMFLLNTGVTVQPRVLLVTSPISMGFTTRFMSKEIRVHANKASSNPTSPNYLIKHNFFAMSADTRQISRLFSPNYDKSRTRCKPSVSRFHEIAAPLISRACLYISVYFISMFLQIHILHIIFSDLVMKGHLNLKHFQDVLKLHLSFQLTWSFWIF